MERQYRKRQSILLSGVAPLEPVLPALQQGGPGRPLGGEVVLRGTSDSQPANDLHEVVHFSVRGRLANFQVLLHADAGEEGQNHPGE